MKNKFFKFLGGFHFDIQQKSFVIVPDEKTQKIPKVGENPSSFNFKLVGLSNSEYVKDNNKHLVVCYF
jgi:hypothetical protein